MQVNEISTVCPVTIGEATMQFVLGIFLFVVVVGVIDARVPWPKPRKNGQQI